MEKLSSLLSEETTLDAKATQLLSDKIATENTRLAVSQIVMATNFRVHALEHRLHVASLASGNTCGLE